MLNGKRLQCKVYLRGKVFLYCGKVTHGIILPSNKEGVNRDSIIAKDGNFCNAVRKSATTRCTFYISIFGGDEMRMLEHYWLSHEEWWHWQDGVQVINDDAPEEAQKSYKMFLEQIKYGVD